MQKQKILILSWEIYPVYCGGLGVLVNHLVKELISQGHKVDILIPNTHGIEVPKNVISLESQIDKISKNFKPIENFKFPLTKFQLTKPRIKSEKIDLIYNNNTPLIAQYYAYAVEDYLKCKKYDMILGMDWTSIPTFVQLQNVKNKTNFAFYINSTEYDRNYGMKKISYCSKIISEIEKKYFKQSSIVFTVSELTSKHLNTIHKVNKSKIKVIHNDSEFVENINPKIKKNKKQILFLGRIVHQKGLLYLLQALRKVRLKDPLINLKIVGSGEYKKKLIKYIDKYNLEPSVKFINWQDGADKLLSFQSASLFAMPSVSEPFGLTALESIRSGTPVLASDMCGFTDLIPSTPTYNYNKSAQLAKNILSLFSSSSNLTTLHDSQLKELRNHSWSEQVKNLCELIFNTNLKEK